MEEKMDPKKLDKVVTHTLEAIENSKKEIFDISETARNEVKRAEGEMFRIKKETADIIVELDNLEAELKKSKQKLLHFSKNFDKYTEEELKEAYESTDKLMVKVAVLREKEKNLIQRRNDMEIRYKDALKMVEKSDTLISQVSVVFDYLSGNLKDISVKIDGIQQRQALGIKVIKAQEEERHRVAREIHDGPAQLMSNVVLKAEICEKLVDIDVSKAKGELNNLKKVVRESLQDVRRIIYDLRPMSLDDLGLVPTVQRYASNFDESTGIKAEVNISGNLEELKPIVSLTAFRIIQESLNNVKKHSKAELVKIILKDKKDKISVAVIDNGEGFDINTKRDSTNTESGFGLYSMRERIELLNGAIEVASEVGKGTEVRVEIPKEIDEEI